MPQTKQAEKPKYARAWWLTIALLLLGFITIAYYDSLKTFAGDLGDATPNESTIVVSPPDLTIGEGMTMVSYAVQLVRVPLQPLEVAIIPDNAVAVDQAVLLFDSNNWNTPQRVSIQAVDDSVAEGIHSGIIKHRVGRYGSTLDEPVVRVTIADND